MPELSFPEETSGHFTTRLDGTRCLISYTTSSYNGWRYVSVSPINELNSSLIFFRNIFYLILLAVSIVGLSFCFYFTKQNSVPLENMLVSLQKQSGSTPLPILIPLALLHDLLLLDIASEPEVYYYPSTVETKLTGLVKSRNYEGIEEMLTLAFFTRKLKTKPYPTDAGDLPMSFLLFQYSTLRSIWM